MNVIQDAATLYTVLQNVTGASGQVSCVLYSLGLYPWLRTQEKNLHIACFYHSTVQLKCKGSNLFFINTMTEALRKYE